MCLVAGLTGPPLVGESAKATLRRPPKTMREAMPRLAWLGMPIAPGARTRLLLWCENGCGEEEVLGVLDPLRNACPCCALCLLTTTQRSKRERARRDMQHMALHGYWVSP